MPKKEKKQNISINTGEPIEETELELGPLSDEEDGEDDGLKLDEEELDPYADKWEQ